MFGNNPFLTKKDPVLGAVQEAMQDGAFRRQAEALVNEEFGVYSRKAVVREQLAAYDARLEEAYKCMKEGKKPNDGNLANNYPPFDKVTRGDVVAGRLGKDQMGGKKKMGEGLDIVNVKTGKNLDGSVQGSGDVTRTPPKEDPSTPKSYPGAASSLTPGNPTQQRMQNMVKEAVKKEYDDKDQSEHGVYKGKKKQGYVVKDKKTGTHTAYHGPQGDDDYGHVDDFPSKRKAVKQIKKSYNLSKNMKEESLAEGVSRKHFQQVADLIKGHESQEKRNELASHHAGIFAKQNPRFNAEKFHTAAGSTAHQAPKKMEEAKKWIQAAIKKKMNEEDSSF